ncbi:hypothetical protein ISCGN_021408 [Ixodes scapularis]
MHAGAAAPAATVKDGDTPRVIVVFMLSAFSEFCLKRFGGSTGSATEMTSQLGACSHGRLVVSAYSLAKPDSPRTNADTDNPFMGARSRFELQLYERRCLFT